MLKFNKLKIFFVFCIKLFFKKLYYCYNFSVYSKIQKSKDILFTFWISNEFNYTGNKSKISFPIDIKGGKCIDIGSGVSIGRNAILNAWVSYLDNFYTPRIIIGDNSHLGEEIHISAITKILIGNNVLIGRRVSIIDNSHGVLTFDNLLIAPSKRELYSKGPIIIGNNVWIGDKVTI